MTENLETFYSFLISLLPFSFVIAAIGLIIAMLTRLFKNDMVKVIGIALFIQTFILGILLIIVQNMVVKNVRSEVIGILSDPKIKISIDSADFGSLQTEELKNELLKLKDISTNHSHAMDKKAIQVISPAGNFNIFIARDSNNPKEFWIFTNRYKSGEDKEIGKIKTSNIVLDNVNRSE
ncbi:hypothetical protein SAMN05421594_0829 [Chryseobacterium oleae]|uniref:Uncharacterized protein n=1 Tax=Chryseobacterium oleae TaxID=491207 RepID=A0A1I4W225_CHROL|nr:hypothetical protein [Chryseobacterium oleae]SFN07522.1 hypothetical protein SAMN05421594_0829 [Chryseobacterium oleae]